MRKSAAPSKKFVSPVIGVKTISANESLKEKENTLTNESGVRKTSQILNILKRNVTQTKPEVFNESESSNKQVIEKENLDIKIDPNKKLFNAVWGKKSTKKHKTWEGDGIVEVLSRTAVLKDLSGSELSRATNIKTELIQDGYILSIGSKEVQILDLIPNNTKFTFKRNAEDNPDENEENVSKKAKYKSSPLLLHLSNKVTKKKRASVVNYEPLIFPQPSAEHQWNFNTSKKSVVDVSVDSCLARVLRPHQRVGVVFLYESILGYKQENCFGAILADEMGLGKTLQCITLIWTLLKQGPYGGIPVIKRCLIVTPSSLVGNWEKEFLSWLGRERIRLFVVNNKNKPKDYVKTSHIPILIISYEMFVRCFDELETIQFDLLICDEGHRLKNSTIKAATLLNQLECKRRIILTGTPIQNDLQEFYSLTDFVNPGFLGSNVEYRKYYEEPIVASREPDADENVKKLGEQRAKELNQKTKNFILRRTQDLLDKYLPTKTECVIFCKSSSLQQDLYSAAVEFWENRDKDNKEVNHLNVITCLKKICNHPSLIKQENNTEDEGINRYLCEMLPNWDEMSPEDSGKLKVLIYLLKHVSDIKEKIVIVSCYTQTLDMLANVCDQHGYKYTRLDGSVPSNQRLSLVDRFNNQYSQESIFFLSSRAGGVGLNLVGAARLVLFDSDWNPATDLQAMARVWRDGQKKNVVIYRLLTTGSIEEKIYQRQISKTGLSGTVVDPSNTKSIKMSDEELKDLFSPEFNCDSSTHMMLKCECSGDGSIPEPVVEQQTDAARACQLGIEVNEVGNNLKMNQLMQWEHHQQPFSDYLLKELGFLHTKHDITYIFRNKCNL